MKKVTLVAIVFFMMHTINAQTGFGAKAGLNIANYSGDDVEDEVDAKIGAYFGVSYEHLINEKFAIQPELLFSMQGAKLDYSEESVEHNQKTKINYINIPILAKYYAVDKLFILAGPQIGFQVSAKYESKTSMDGITLNEDGDLEDMNKVDLAIAVGAGYNFMENLGAEVRYNFGLSDIVENASAKNSVGQIGLFYTF